MRAAARAGHAKKVQKVGCKVRRRGAIAPLFEKGTRAKLHDRRHLVFFRRVTGRFSSCSIRPDLHFGLLRADLTLCPRESSPSCLPVFLDWSCGFFVCVVYAASFAALQSVNRSFLLFRRLSPAQAPPRSLRTCPKRTLAITSPLPLFPPSLAEPPPV
jgi:hypothetical protein